MKYKIFIGYDRKQHEASRVCEYSIRKHLKHPDLFDIQHLKVDELREQGLYYNDTRKASTEFSYTRFLVPHLCDYKGLALFVDSDFIFTTDLQVLFEKIERSDEALDRSVWVTQHAPYTPKQDTKFYGEKQEALPMKNWSSLMLFDCAHRDCKQLNPMNVNNRSAQWLHRFEWTRILRMGHIPFMWNWLVGEYEIDPEDGLPLPWGIHYTNGGPFNNVHGQDLEYVWLEYKSEMLTNEK